MWILPYKSLTQRETIKVFYFSFKLIKKLMASKKFENFPDPKDFLVGISLLRSAELSRRERTPRKKKIYNVLQK